MAEQHLEQSIFLHAIERSSPADRAAYLDEACGENSGLRAEVDALLAAHDRLDGSPEPPAQPEATRTFTAAAETAGTIIGPYKLIEPIGEGGMGTVWMARQTEPVKRLVALKLIKAGMDSRQVLARFEAERQALALMDHPNIARVLDAGSTGAGRPYFVMELVRGAPITRYCDEKQLTVRERMALFGDVCRAVQHAHQKGVIHRDLKPSNILVAPFDGRPLVKVIDFGVAKATWQRLTDESLLTGFGTLVGTLEYMSPEQAEANNQDIDTRSDIYSLGVVLYELLTGSTPLTRKRVQEAALLELLRVIREEEPPRPSTRLSGTEVLPSVAALRHTEPAKLTKLVRGDLDWIVMKALEKDRSRRYETANGFAMDVQRYLADEPVLACPPSAAYRIRKFARRNKGSLAVASLVLFFVVLLGSGIGWAVRDREARQAKVGGRVESTLTEVDRFEQQQKWPEALAAARRAEAVAAGGEAEPETIRRVRERVRNLEFIDRLEQIRMQVATWSKGTGFDSAREDREFTRAFRDYGLDVDALSVETLMTRLKARPTYAIPLAAVLDEWANTRRVLTEREPRGKTSDWIRLSTIACGIDSNPLRNQVRTAWRKPFPDMQRELRRLATSIDVRALHPATLHLLTRTVRGRHPDYALSLLRDAQEVYPTDFWLNFQLGFLLHERKDYAGAVRFYTAAASLRPNSAAIHNNLGLALHENKQLDEAVRHFGIAIELDPRHATAYDHLGNTLRHQKKLEPAIASYRKAIELDPKLASPHNNLGLALNEQKKFVEAMACFKKSIELDPNVSSTYNNLGISLYDQKKAEEAIAQFRKAIQVDPADANAHRNLGKVLREQHQLIEAVACCRKAVELGPNDADAHNVLGLALAVQGTLDEAIACYRKALEVDPKYAVAHNNLGLAFERQGKREEAMACYRKAIEFDPNLAQAHSNLGAALQKEHQPLEAVACCRKAVELGPDEACARTNLGLVLAGQGKLDEAIAEYRAALGLDPKFTLARHNLGAVLRIQGRLDEALADSRTAVDLDPRSALAHLGLGYSFRAKGKHDESLVEFRAAVELDPKLAAAHVALGGALHAVGKHEEAVDSYRTALTLEPKSPLAHNGLGIALKSQGKLDDAIAVYRKAMELDPKQAGFRQNLSGILATKGWKLANQPDTRLRKPQRAIELAREAVELAPESTEAWQWLGWICYRAGEWRDSVEALENSCRLQKGGQGDCGQWIVLALAHAQLAAQEDLTEQERGQHAQEAQRWYGEASKQLDAWGARPGDPVGQSIWDFRTEAKALLGPEETTKQVPAGQRL